MKRLGVLFLALSMGLMAGCSRAEESFVEQSRSVEVIEAQLTENEVTLPYIGTVDSKEIVKYSFKTPGKISKIFVEKGQKVSIGDPLAELDVQELKFQLDAAHATLQTAELNVQKAKQATAYDESYLEKMEALYEGNAISKDAFDQLELKTSISNSAYKQAAEQANAARVDYDYKKYLIDNTIIRAESEGMIVEILSKENEQVGAYYPVVAVRSDVQIINVGIAQRDLDVVTEGMKATINVDGKIAEGYISNISEAPDMATRTYNAEVMLTNESFRLGSIAKVDFKAGTQKGMWIPVKSVLSNGEDFVYVIESERAFKKVVEPVSIHDGLMQVIGLDEGDVIVTSGMKNLSDGYKVLINE